MSFARFRVKNVILLLKSLRVLGNVPELLEKTGEATEIMIDWQKQVSLIGIT